MFCTFDNPEPLLKQLNQQKPMLHGHGHGDTAIFEK